MHKSTKAPVPETLVIPHIFASTHPTICKQKELFAKKIWDVSVVKINENHLMLKDESLNREKKNPSSQYQIRWQGFYTFHSNWTEWMDQMSLFFIYSNKCAYA